MLAGICQIAIACLFTLGHVDWVSISVLFVLKGSANALFMPASAGILPAIVAPRDLRTANAALRLGMNTVRMSGAAAAAALATTVGTGAVLWFDGVTYVIASIALLVTVSGNSPAARKRSPLGHDLHVGWREFISRRWVVIPVLQMSYVNAAYSAFIVILGPALSKLGGVGIAGWSVIVTTQAVGLIGGSLVALRVSFRRPIAVAVLLPCSKALPMGLLALHAPLWRVMLAILASAVLTDLYSVTWDSTLQGGVPVEALSRVSSYDMLASFSGAPLGIAIVGLLLNFADPETILLACALGVLVSGPIALSCRSVREFRFTTGVDSLATSEARR